jgi:hypothetical protein
MESGGAIKCRRFGLLLGFRTSAQICIAPEAVPQPDDRSLPMQMMVAGIPQSTGA